MSERQHRGLLAAALSSVGSFLVEPAEGADRPQPAVEPAATPIRRVVVAVFGLARGCGTTVVARALAAELATRDAARAATVACERPPAGVRLASPAATRLARLVEDFPGAACRAAGRTCLAHGVDPSALSEGASHLAPLVLDAGSACLGGVPAAVADRCVIVSTAALEPALARVACECLARVGPEPIVVVNRVSDPAPATRAGPDAVLLPESRLGARVALAGREPGGELGCAVAMLADRCAP